MSPEILTVLLNTIRHPNDIMILGFALVLYGVYQVFRKSTE